MITKSAPGISGADFLRIDFHFLLPAGAPKSFLIRKSKCKLFQWDLVAEPDFISLDVFQRNKIGKLKPEAQKQLGLNAHE